MQAGNGTQGSASVALAGEREPRLTAPAADTRRLIDNVLALAVLQGASFLLPLVTLPYLTRVLGPGRFGLVAFAQSTVQYLVILTDFGFNISATRAISLRRDDRAEVSAIFSAVLLLKVALAVIGAIVFAFAIAFASRMSAEWRLFAFAFGIVVGNVIFPVWLFQGLERMRFVAALSVLAKLVFTVLVFVLVRTSDDYLLVPLLNSAGTVLAGILSIGIAIRSFGVRLRWPTREALVTHLRDSLGYFVSRVSVTLYTSSNVFFLGIASSPVSVGLYSSAERVYGAMQGIYSPVTNALMPYMARTRNRILFRRILVVAALVNGVGCAALILLSDRIVRFAFGASYADAAPVLRLLSAAMILVVPTFLLGYPFLAALGHARYANQSAVIGSIFHLIGLAALVAIGALGPRNVAALVVATEGIVLSLRVYGVVKTGVWREAVTVDARDCAESSPATAGATARTRMS